MSESIVIRECTTLEELGRCVELQREVFTLPEIEISPVRHLIVSRNAGGFILGAYDDDRLVGFVLSVPAFIRGSAAFYSHMTAVLGSHQSSGIGARLKWAQREEALRRGVKFIKWTFEPWKARNAYFNLEKLGAVIREYAVDFYGTDRTTMPYAPEGLASDRVFAEWNLEDEKVEALAAGNAWIETRPSVAEIELPPDWNSVLAEGVQAAVSVQVRVREQFLEALGRGLSIAGFRRDAQHPAYLAFE